MCDCASILSPCNWVELGLRRGTGTGMAVELSFQRKVNNGVGQIF